jgi:DNA replication protein DnaC
MKMSEEEQLEFREKQNREWAKYSSIRGDRYSRCRLDNFIGTPENATVYLQCRRMAKEAEFWRRNILWLGPAGTGKDHLMSALAFEAVRHGCFGLKWTTGVELFDDLKQSLGEESLHEAVQRYKAARLLMISDIAWMGAELSKFEQQEFYRVIDHRYAMNKPVWITANALTRNQLNEILGVHIADRLIDDATVFVCNWETFRKVKETIKD